MINLTILYHWFCFQWILISLCYDMIVFINNSYDNDNFWLQCAAIYKKNCDCVIRNIYKKKSTIRGQLAAIQQQQQRSSQWWRRRHQVVVLLTLYGSSLVLIFFVLFSSSVDHNSSVVGCGILPWRISTNIHYIRLLPTTTNKNNNNEEWTFNVNPLHHLRCFCCCCCCCYYHSLFPFLK